MRIAIIGAGVAGLTAARELVRAGHSVDVFEKSCGLGGRAGTRRLEWGEVDLGVQYFTVRSQFFKVQVAAWVRRRQAAIWQFTPFLYERDQINPSADKTDRYVGMPGMRVLARDLGVETLVHYKQKVIGLEKKSKGWRLQTEAGPFEYFDWVIASQPCEQARELLEGNTALLRSLPDSVHNQCWALALATQGLVPAAIKGVFSRDKVSWLSRISARPGYDRENLRAAGIDDVWLLHFSPDWSKKQGKLLPQKELVAIGSRWLNRFLKHYGCAPVTLKHSNTHFWRYAQVCSPWLEQADGKIFTDESNRIAAIGAWCHSGRYEDGFLSGLKIAQHLTG